MMMKKPLKYVYLMLVVIIFAPFFWYIYYKPDKIPDLKNLHKEEYISPFVRNINQNTHLKKFTGKNVKIAIIDSGIDSNHIEIKNKIEKGYNFIELNNNTKDYFGHGTAIAGIIAASKNNQGIVGVAPDSKIYPLVVLDRDGKGKIENVIKAIEWSIENNMDIINLSFSTRSNNKGLQEVIQKALAKNIIVVASYYNSKNTFNFPAMYNGVLGVKSTNSYELKLDGNIVYAPGNQIITLNLKNSYQVMNGNSYAAAYVTGYIARLKELYRDWGDPLSADEVFIELENLN